MAGLAERESLDLYWQFLARASASGDGAPAQEHGASQGLGYAFALLFATCAQSLVTQHYFIFQQAAGQRMGAVLKAAVLDHMMELPAAAQAGSDAGAVTALLGNIDHLTHCVYALNVGNFIELDADQPILVVDMKVQSTLLRSSSLFVLVALK